MLKYGTVMRYFCRRNQTSKNMDRTKHVIIPVGSNAAQCKEYVMQQLPSSYAYEWMESENFVREHLYCTEDGSYDPSLEVWLLVWDSPSNMVPKSHPNPNVKHTCSNTELQIAAMGVNLLWCKAHHANIKRHLIYILPPRFNSKLYDRPLDRHFLGMDDIHVIDMQEELSKVNGNTPLSDFLEIIDLRVAEVIAGKKPQKEHFRDTSANNRSVHYTHEL